MKHRNSLRMTPWFGLLLLIAACSRQPESPAVSTGPFAVRDFNPMTNWRIDSSGKENGVPNGKKLLYLDYPGPRESGFLIPSGRQTEDGLFHLEFFIKNTGDEPAQYAYKIFYQNESYKFPERDPDDTLRMHPYAWENFYGSWEEVTTTFVATDEIPADGDFHRVTGRFRIVGNPRDEQRYYSNGQNDRWKRNPRVGEYSFMLVVTTKETADTNGIPPFIQNISLMHDSAFINPFYYFKYGEGATLPHTIVSYDPHALKVVAKPDPGAGIYINPWYYPADKYGKSFTANCGNSQALYQKAAFEQFVFHELAGHNKGDHQFIQTKQALDIHGGDPNS